MSDEKIEFLAKYKDWLSVKRLNIDDTTRPKDIVYILGAIWGTVEEKLERYLVESGVDKTQLDAQAEKIAKELGKRVTVSLKGVDDELSKEVAKIYVIRKAMEIAKWPIEINTKKLLKLVRK
jgi:hypothetical protein